MAIWRRKRSADDAPPRLVLPSLEEAAEDGFAMARQAAIMSVKNKILVQAITRPESFDPTIFLAPAKDAVMLLAVENLETAKAVDSDLQRARTRRGEAISRSDFRKGDVANLTRRYETLEKVALMLQEHAHDEQWLRKLITDAHDLAWAEISREMERSLDRKEALEFGDEHYEEDRADRLRQFINLDLAQLIEDNTPEY